MNLVDQRNKIEDIRKNHVLNRTSVAQKNFKSDYKLKQNELVDIMVKYDIKHPLRGNAYEDVKTGQLDFKDKIIMIVS